MIADRKSSLMNDNASLMMAGSRSVKAATSNNIKHLKPKDVKL
tara:strand:+ start:1489 stop:1617 length:129 start_codon:yes stop_codon:yes gene_type:complete